MFSIFLKKINESLDWKKPLKIRGKWFVPITLDRLVALLLHNVFPKANPFTVWLKQRGHLGGLVLDIGANQGLFALAASQVVGVNGLVHAFEPDQDLFNWLETNILLN